MAEFRNSILALCGFSPSLRFLNAVAWGAEVDWPDVDQITASALRLSAQIDWSRHPRFRDKELTQIAQVADAGSVVADKLVEVHLRDGSAQWVLVHVEVQAQRDGSLARRVLEYNYRIYKEYRRPVATVSASLE